MPAPMPRDNDRAARATWAAHYATPSGFRYMPSEELVRFVGRHRGSLGRVLEVGCGNGANLWYLAKQAEQAVGVDFVPGVLEFARGLLLEYGQRAGLAAASADRLPFPAGSFDTVVDLMVSQHLPWEAHREVYGEYRRVLRLGGRLFLYHLDAGTSGSRQGQPDYPDGIALFPDAGRVCLPRRGTLAARMATSGFGPVEQRGMERTYPDGTRASYAVLEGVACE